MRIPVSSVDLPEDVAAEVLAVLRSGQLAQGARVAALESGVAELMNVRNVVAVSNGTTALVAALRSLRLPPESEVVTSPFTFVATVNACLIAGLRVRFADINPDDFALDASAAARAIGPSTRCLLPVHLYGQTGDMNALMRVATEHGLLVVEDAAQALLATSEGKFAGTWGTGCFSLYATKNLTSGEGGLITTDDDEQASWLRAYRNQGMVQQYVYEILGENCRLTDIQAAIALPQLKTYEQNVTARRENARLLQEGLDGVSGLHIPREMNGRHHVWHQFTVIVDPASGVTRDQVADGLARRGIGAGIYYPRLLGDYPHIGTDPRVTVGNTPNAASIAASCLSLPVHPRVTPHQIDEIIDGVRSAMERRA